MTASARLTSYHYAVDETLLRTIAAEIQRQSLALRCGCSVPAPAVPQGPIRILTCW